MVHRLRSGGWGGGAGRKVRLGTKRERRGGRGKAVGAVSVWLEAGSEVG